MKEELNLDYFRRLESQNESWDNFSKYQLVSPNILFVVIVLSKDFGNETVEDKNMK